MGDHNWDLSTNGWRDLNLALRDEQVARARDFIPSTRTRAPMREMQIDEAADALWDRGELF